MSDGDQASRAVIGRRPVVLVSACLCGVACNHEGAPAKRDVGTHLRDAGMVVVPFCPEVVGGLSTPRPAAEIDPATGRVVNVEGDDVTAAYQRGANAAVELARAVGAERAVLKARSPSCGTGRVYDGSFTRTLRDGDGVTAAALRAAGVEVSSEADL